MSATPYAADLTVVEVAQLLHIHRNTVLALIDAGKLEAYRIGTGTRGPWRFTRASVAAFRKRAIRLTDTDD